MADVEFSHGMVAYGRARTSVAQEPDSQTSVATFTNIAGAFVSLALIAGVGVWGYELMVRDVSGIPVVRAVEGDMRVRPDDPGGQLARHQGLAVNTIAEQGVAAGPVDQVILAPRATDLSAEDQPVMIDAAAPIEQPAPLAPADEQIAANTAVPVVANITERLQQGAIDDVVAELTQDSVPLVDMPVVKSVKPTRTAALTEVESVSDTVIDEAPIAAVLEAPGVRTSIRPKRRPDDVRAMIQPVSYTEPETSRDIDPAAIPAGTRLAQLGAFDSEDVARGEWARLQSRFGAYLQDKSRVIQQAQSNGRTFYRLRAMGFVDLSDARRFCSAFKAEGVDCIPVQIK